MDPNRERVLIEQFHTVFTALHGENNSLKRRIEEVLNSNAALEQDNISKTRRIHELTEAAENVNCMDVLSNYFDLKLLEHFGEPPSHPTTLKNRKQLKDQLVRVTAKFSDEVMLNKSSGRSWFDVSDVSSYCQKKSVFTNFNRDYKDRVLLIVFY